MSQGKALKEPKKPVGTFISLSSVLKKVDFGHFLLDKKRDLCYYLQGKIFDF